MYYCEQQAIVQAHMDPESFEKMSAQDWSKIMSAKAKKERPVDISDWVLSQMAKKNYRKEGY